MVTTHPSERARQPGNTGEYELKDTRGEGQLLFPFSYTQVTKGKQNALKPLRCQQLQITPYAFRHGGASDDRAVNARSLQDVQKRGGWKSFNSVRRYEKHARWFLVMSKIPPELLQQVPALERDLERLWKRFSACAHWIHFKRQTSFPLRFQHSPSCWHNLERSRISFWTLPAVQRLTLDNLVWLRRCWGGLRQAEFWACRVERRR